MNPRKHRAASHKAGTVRETRAPPHPTRKRSKRSNGAPRNGKIRASCMIRGVCAAKRPLRGKIFARCIPKRLFAGLFGCMARESCHELAIFPSEAPFGIHEAQNLPRIAARERTRAKYCHRQAPENAPWRHGAGRRHANETLANSTPHADTSKKP